MDIYSSYANDELWLIKETEFVKELQGVRESQFSLGNGYLGTRGICEEIPYDCLAGTYIAGLFDKMTAQVSELVNLPNPVNFMLSIGGEKIDAFAMDILSHSRTLNLKKALLLRHTIYRDSKRRRYDYQSLRFISQHNKNIGLMQIALTPFDAACVLDINTGIDTSVSNAGILSEGRKKHFRIRELGQYRDAGYLVTETFEKRYTIIYWAGFYYQLDNGQKIVAKDNIFRLKLKKDQTVIFTKVFCIKHFPCRNNHIAQKRKVFALFSDAFRTDFSLLLKSHTEAWEKLWKKADVIVGGTANIQQNIRFNIYHMLICLNYDRGASSIGARTLSGEGYRGHIFWDAEIFLFPFYLFTFPQAAKNMLLYRFRRLDTARRLAAQNGYKGAQFPWESGATGEEETPEWARDFDRTIIKIYTHKMEHHITACVAYAFYKYYLVTGDKKFMRDCGYEVFVETARFWASRVEYNKKTKNYEIKRIIGPDEFHLNVNNNAFTNVMAKWNLLTAVKLIQGMKKDQKFYRSFKKKLDLSEQEVRSFRQIASRIKLSIDQKNIIEQFDGYFRLKRVVLNQTDENGILVIPNKLKPKDLEKTQIVKQADVLMLLCLLSDVFKMSTKVANYNFYIARTVHKSSLSASIHAYLASEVGDLHRAYNLFNVALRSDISNLYGNTCEGIHAACLGGTWQSLLFGFGGLSLKKENLFINPRMPKSWQKLIFTLTWRGNPLKLELTNNSIKIKLISTKEKNIRIGIFGRLLVLKAEKTYNFKRPAKESKGEEYY